MSNQTIGPISLVIGAINKEAIQGVKEVEDAVKASTERTATFTNNVPFQLAGGGGPLDNIEEAVEKLKRQEKAADEARARAHDAQQARNRAQATSDADFERKLNEASSMSRKAKSLQAEAQNADQLDHAEATRLAAALNEAAQAGVRLDGAISRVNNRLKELGTQSGRGRTNVQNVVEDEAPTLNGQGSGRRAFRYAAQNVAYGFEDALVSFQYNGIGGAARAAGNNLSALASLIQNPISSGVTIAGISVVTAAVGMLGDAIQREMKKGAEAVGELYKALDRTIARLESAEKLKLSIVDESNAKQNERDIKKAELDFEQAQRRMRIAMPFANDARNRLNQAQNEDDWQNRNVWTMLGYNLSGFMTNQNGWWTRQERRNRAEKELESRMGVIRDADNDMESSKETQEIRRKNSENIYRREQQKKLDADWKSTQEAIRDLTDSAFETGGKDFKLDRLRSRFSREFDALNKSGLLPHELEQVLPVQRARQKIAEFDLAEEEKNRNKFFDKPFNEAMDVGSRQEAEMYQKLTFGIDDRSEAKAQRQQLVDLLKEALAQLRKFSENRAPVVLPILQVD